MDPTTLIALLIASGAIGLALGYVLRWLIARAQRNSIDIRVKKIALKAKQEAEAITDKAKTEAADILSEAQSEADKTAAEIKQKEAHLTKKEELLDKRQLELQQELVIVRDKQETIDSLESEVEELKKEHIEALETTAELTKTEARKQLFSNLETEHVAELARRRRKLEQERRTQLEAQGRDMVVNAIERYSGSINHDVLTTTLKLPADDIKGRIIGRDGRNIKAFERETGVQLVIDETPALVQISCFDPIRRAVAKNALEKLVEDGRIQPTRIKKFVETAKQEIDKIIKTKGQEATYELDIYSLDERIISILGRLHFRTSYGQNVLAHSVEMAHMAGMLAEELGADVETAKIGALVHDIGKAVDHEVSGTHVEIGMRILDKFEAPKEVITAMQSHHDDYPHESVEAIIVQITDTISAARPGARGTSLESYLDRLSELETIATRQVGVESAYALEAGRELRVLVNPSKVSDESAYRIAREIAKAIEQEMSYPGEIKVHVIRENSITEYAR